MLQDSVFEARHRWRVSNVLQEERSWFFFLLLSVLYGAGTVWYAIARPLWHDELFTYYISQASTLRELIRNIRENDLNPPLIYLLTRISHTLFGYSTLATRLPEIAGFYVGSMCFYKFLEHRVRASFAALGVLVFWMSPICWRLSTEARPYGLLFGFFGGVLLCWQKAIQPGPRTKTLLLLAFCVLGMVLSHVFAILMLLPFVVAEIARLFQTRRPDWPLWLAFALPLIGIVSYAPLINRYAHGLFPPAFQGSIERIALSAFEFYDPTSLLAVVLAFLAGLAITLFERKRVNRLVSRPNPVDAALIVGSLLIPAVVIATLMRMQGAYFPRYSFLAVVGISLLVAWTLNSFTSASRRASLTAVIVLILFFVFRTERVTALELRLARQIGAFDQIDPGLPFVDASGLTFLEMDKNEHPQFLSRLFYLTDPEYSAKYAHATIFEGMAELKNIFPIRANVATYREFVRTHRQFLVLGTPGYPEDWLLSALHDNGASVENVGTFRSIYKDSLLFKVTLMSPAQLGFVHLNELSGSSAPGKSRFPCNLVVMATGSKSIRMQLYT